MYNVKYRIYNVKCIIESVWCKMCNVKCTIYNVKCVIESVWCKMYNVKYTIYNVKCTIESVWCKMCNVICIIKTTRLYSYNLNKFNVSKRQNISLALQI